LRIEGENVVFDLDQRLSPPDKEKVIKTFVDNYLNALKAAQDIKNLYSSIPLSGDGCNNHGFESGYISWTGLSLKHGLQQIPIENGVVANPGIAVLPFTSTGMGGNYTALQST